MMILMAQGRSQRLYHVEAHQKMEDYGYFTFQIANNKGADLAARMRRLVCTLVVRKQQSQGVSHQGPYDVEAQASWPPPGYAPVCLFCCFTSQDNSYSHGGMVSSSNHTFSWTCLTSG